MQALGQPALARRRLEALEVAAHLLELGLDGAGLTGAVAVLGLQRRLETADEGRHHVILHQALAQGGQDLFLQHLAAHAARVGAGRRQPSDLAGQIVLARIAQLIAAAGTYGAAGQQVLATVLPRLAGADLLGGLAAADRRQPGLNPVPQVARDEGELGHVHTDPLVLVVDAADALGVILGIAHEALPIPQHRADVQFVAQNAAGAIGMAADRGAMPDAAARPRNVPRIQILGNLVGAEAAVVALEDFDDQLRLLRIDLIFAAEQLTLGGVGLAHRETVGQPGDDLAAQDLFPQRPASLEADRLEVQRIGDAAHRDVQARNLAFVQGHQLDAVVLQPLEHSMGLLGVTGDAVEGLGQHEVGATTPGEGQHRLVARARLGRAGDHRVGIFADHRPAHMGGEIADDRELRLDGGGVLLGVGIPGIKDGTARLGLQVGGAKPHVVISSLGRL